MKGLCFKNTSFAWHTQAALGAGMRCLVTYTNSTKSQKFDGAEYVVSSLSKSVPLSDLLQVASAAYDDRVTQKV